MSHTKEPWIVSEETFDNDGIQESVIRGLDARAAIAVTLEFGENNPEMREASAQRIAACVNACAGIPNHMINHVVAFGLQGHNKISAELTEARNALLREGMQRDELLVALEAVMSMSVRGEQLRDRLQFSTPGREILDLANTAIANAKGHKSVVRDERTTDSSIPAIVFFPSGSLGEEVAP